MKRFYPLLQTLFLILTLIGGTRLFTGESNSAGMVIGCLAMSLLFGLMGGTPKK